MPLYEYVCNSCGQRFELLVRTDTVIACPDCGGDDLRKLLSPFAVSVAASAPPRDAAPAPCGQCGHPDGPGACQYQA